MRINIYIFKYTYVHALISTYILYIYMSVIYHSLKVLDARILSKQAASMEALTDTSISRPFL